MCFRHKCDPIRLVTTDAIAAAKLAVGVWSKSAGRETLRVPATLCCVFPEGSLCCHGHRASHKSSPRYSCRCVHPSDPDRACEAQLCVPAAFLSGVHRCDRGSEWPLMGDRLFLFRNPDGPGPQWCYDQESRYPMVYRTSKGDGEKYKDK